MITQKGTRLICRLETCKQQMWNSQLLTVTEFCEKIVQLKCDDTDRRDTVPHSFVAEKTQLGYCFTIASAQGRTLNGSVAIWDTRHPRFSNATCLPV